MSHFALLISDTHIGSWYAPWPPEYTPCNLNTGDPEVDPRNGSPLTLTSPINTSLKYHELWQDRMTRRLESIYFLAGKLALRAEENTPKIDRKGLLEALARHSHSQWMEWSKEIAENECLSPARLKRWQGQLWKPYDELTEEWKEQDRIRAREILAIVEGFQRDANNQQIGKGWDP